MPAISSRMSISSSTTRISGETSDPFCFMREPLFHFPRPAQGEDHANDRPSYFAAFCVCAWVFGCIFEQQLSPMVFQNLADNGEAEPRPFCARRDIGLREPVPVLRRQANAVVTYGNREPRALYGQFDRDVSGRGVAGGNTRRNRFGGV